MANDSSAAIANDLVEDYLRTKKYPLASSAFAAAVAGSEQNGDSGDRGR